MPLSSIEIIYADADILVVNKPTLLLSVPGRAADNKDCLITRLQDNGYPDALIVHRLDWETTGLMVLARNAEAHRELSRQFHDREVEKRYTALCWGQFTEDAGQVELPLRYDPPNKPRQIVDHELGKHALTFWQVLERNPDYCRIELTPYTGRSHQLRVHMQAIDHPILGDILYAHDLAVQAAPRLCLHANALSITQPNSKQRLDFNCPTPF
ncbi:RluA family pseudouridine synthase [Denitrificimonas caeni]|uniref:Dual-specificity RNA pseudouridine synthase RluA n=1 Tax=Denitrificimonas caeni TaxID=521720 RepID=A0AAF0AJX2_9GAMM|nr:RluA family pseudouridine synthase [Denitrificimonas caeni]NLJ12553.1 RluA family pseudouridine synthase [Gammaproteobacteria bacterium]WBE26469.1 RluA family pseudouridine synthase [Denitrificimonas caeni]